MGITGEPYPYNSARGRECFYCYLPLDDPAVMWIGEHDIFFHPHCVLNLAIRLFRDVHEIQCRQNREIHEHFNR